uniref:Transposase n=1 Tax=Panagrellus redivivus TaxID=6233 RepID=A0A7E4WE59_PANRE
MRNQTEAWMRRDTGKQITNDERLIDKRRTRGQGRWLAHLILRRKGGDAILIRCASITPRCGDSAVVRGGEEHMSVVGLRRLKDELTSLLHVLLRFLRSS